VLAREFKPRPPKAPLYQKAFERFCAGETDLCALANSLGLRPDALVDLAGRRNWFAHVGAIRTQQAVSEVSNRGQLAVQVDNALVESATHHVETFTEGWREIGAKVLVMPIEPDASFPPEAKEKERVRLLTRKADLMRQVSQGVREMTLVASEIGLVKAGPRAEGETDGKLDLSKLSQLNITINNALAEVERPAMAPIELPDAGEAEDVPEFE